MFNPPDRVALDAVGPRSRGLGLLPIAVSARRWMLGEDAGSGMNNGENLRPRVRTRSLIRPYGGGFQPLWSSTRPPSLLSFPGYHFVRLDPSSSKLWCFVVMNPFIVVRTPAMASRRGDPSTSPTDRDD